MNGDGFNENEAPPTGGRESLRLVLSNFLGNMFRPASKPAKYTAKEILDKLQPVKVEDLDPDERSCPICYDCYSNETKEDIIEAIKETQNLISQHKEVLAPFDTMIAEDPHLEFPTEPTGHRKVDRFSPFEVKTVKGIQKSMGLSTVTEREQRHKNQPVRMPECRHVFCGECIRSWLETTNTCPVCRAELEYNDSVVYDFALREDMIPADWSGAGSNFRDPPLNMLHAVENGGGIRGTRTGPRPSRVVEQPSGFGLFSQP